MTKSVNVNHDDIIASLYQVKKELVYFVAERSTLAISTVALHCKKKVI